MTVALSIPVRPGGPADAADCAAILNDWIDATDWMPRCHAPEDVSRYYRDEVFAKRQVWVAGTPIAGFLALDGDVVTALYVGSPGQGIGRALLDRAKAGREALTLWTFEANTQARAFYAREGFVEVRRTDGDNEEGLPDIQVRWTRDGGVA